MTRQSATHNAALGLVRLASDPSASGAALPVVHTGGGWADEARREGFHGRAMLEGMVLEAQRRGVARLGAGLTPATAALEGVLRLIEQAPWVWKSDEAEAMPADNISYTVLNDLVAVR
jgi:hypothetical protein